MIFDKEQILKKKITNDIESIYMHKNPDTYSKMIKKILIKLFQRIL